MRAAFPAVLFGVLPREDLSPPGPPLRILERSLLNCLGDS